MRVRSGSTEMLSEQSERSFEDRRRTWLYVEDARSEYALGRQQIREFRPKPRE
jgi:hypothetical protein